MSRRSTEVTIPLFELVRDIEDDVHVARDLATVLDIVFNRPKVALSEEEFAALGRNVIALRDATKAVLTFWDKAYAMGLAEHERANGGGA